MKNKILLGIGSLFGIWSVAALSSALNVTGSLTELVNQYMVAVGLVTPLHTLVDYYTHIKGIEYLICVAFFIAFPMFFKYVNSEKTTVKQII